MDDAKKNKSRRDFLRFGLTAGAASLVGLGGAVVASEPDDDKKTGRKIKVLTSDGKLVEVDETQIRPVEKEEVIPIDKAREGLPNKKFVM